MFEAYKVGITIAVTNHVSAALALMGRDLTATDAKAIRLKNTLKEIKLLGMGGILIGGAGLLGLRALDKSYEAAKKYEQVFNQFKTLNLGDAINKNADHFARGANVIGASATDLMSTVRDLHTALGDYGMARQLAPGIAQMKFANQAVFGEHGMDMSDRQLQAMEKIIEMKGGFKSPASFMAQANMMQKVISGTGGMVKPSDYLQFIKTAGVGGRLLSDESFYYTMEPLIQEMSGGRVGTGTMSAYNNLAQGRSTVRAAKEMMKLGLLDPKMVEYDKIGQVKRIQPGALKGMDEFTSKPYQWMKDVLIPALQAKGITSETGILNEMGAIFGNRTGSNLFSLMYLQQAKIEKNMAISKNAMGVDQLLKLAKSSPQGAEEAIGKAWLNLDIAVGEVLIPIIIPGLLKLADGIRELGKWINLHPIRFKYLIEGFAGLAVAMTIAGTILLLTAGFKALGLALEILGMGGLAKVLSYVGLVIRTAIPLVLVALRGLGAMFIASGPIGWTIAGIGLLVVAGYQIYKHWDAIKPKLYAVWEGIKGWLSSIFQWIADVGKKIAEHLTPGDTSGAYSVAKLGLVVSQPPASNKATVDVQVRDPYHLARVVTRTQESMMNAPTASGSGFDGRKSFIAPSSNPLM